MKRIVLILTIVSSSIFAEGITDLWLQMGYDPEQPVGEAYINNMDSRYYSIYREDFLYARSAEEDTSENLWWTTFMVNFEGWEAPATTMYDTWTEECPGEDDWGCSNNGTIHENTWATDWDIQGFVKELDGYELDTLYLMGHAASQLSILAIHYVPDGSNGKSTILQFVLRNDGTTALNHCDAYLVSDIDAGGAWWPDPEFTDWEDGWDALEWNNSGLDTSTRMVYQYFHPAMLDTNEDGSSDYPNAEPYMYVGTAKVAGGPDDEDWWSAGVGDNWLDLAVDDGIFLEIDSDDYEYDGYYEADSTMDDLWSYLAIGCVDLDPGDETEVVFAMVAAETEAELSAAAAAARSAWGGTGASIDEGSSSLPKKFTLHQNYPNPFNPSTAITFDLKQREKINLDIYDMNGNHIANLVNNTFTPGTHTVRWQGLTTKGEIVPSGVYLYRLSAGNKSQTRKMLFIK